MTEFTSGIFKVIASTSAGRALVYTAGHIIIAMTVVSIVTGASLFEAGISPFKLANSLNKKNIKILKNKIQKVLKKAIKLKGSSINDYKTPMGTLGSFQNNFKVYNREGKSCKNIYCGKKIIRTIISGRSAYFCKNCQKN